MVIPEAEVMVVVEVEVELQWHKVMIMMISQVRQHQQVIYDAVHLVGKLGKKVLMTEICVHVYAYMYTCTCIHINHRVIHIVYAITIIMYCIIKL